MIMDNLVCTVDIIKMPSPTASTTAALCCVKQLSLSPERYLLIYPSLSDSCYFFEKPSGFVSVSCLSLSPLKMIDRAGKSSAQLLSLTHPREIERNSEKDHPSSKAFFVCVDDVKRSTFFKYLLFIKTFFSFFLALHAIIITLQMKIVIRVTFCFFFFLIRNINLYLFICSLVLFLCQFRICKHCLSCMLS